jgi:16S rRNA (guanine527-N7)-methyltransferase
MMNSDSRKNLSQKRPVTKRLPGPARETEWEPQIEHLLEEVANDGIHCVDGSCKRLAVFCRAISAAAARADLVSMRDLPHLVDKHIAASLGILRVELPQPTERWIDVGTGGGFPGMVIKLCLPESSITLLDSSRKKTLFLAELGERLDIPDLVVQWARVEDLPRPNPSGTRTDPDDACEDAYDVILMRAVTSIARSVEWIDGITRPGGRLLTFKGPDWKSELAKAEGTLRRLGWSLDGVHSIPWASPRILRFLKSHSR